MRRCLDLVSMPAYTVSAGCFLVVFLMTANPVFLICTGILLVSSLLFYRDFRTALAEKGTASKEEISEDERIVLDMLKSGLTTEQVFNDLGVDYSGFRISDWKDAVPGRRARCFHAERAGAEKRKAERVAKTSAQLVDGDFKRLLKED